MAERVIKKGCDYQLVGPTSAMQTTWQYPDTNVKRLSVPAAKLGMDKGGTIDKAKQRYFSLSVPAPDTIVPYHPASMLVGGKHSPFTKEELIPVGYVFIYQNTDLSSVKVKCPSDSTVWDPMLSPLPYESESSIIVEMTSMLDSDPCHTVAINSFGNQRDLYQNVNIGTSLDLEVCYPDDSPPCPNLCPQKDSLAKGSTTSSDSWAFTHTGADCKAAIIEITDASNSVVLG
jgi:hypothetical protein